MNQAILDRIQLHLSSAKSRLPHLRVLPEIRCKDGLRLSVQASQYHHCTPDSDTGPWSHVEIGYPSFRVNALMPYAEDAEKPLDTVYNYVPVSVVATVIEAAGGFED